MRLVRLYAASQTLELLRYPSFSVPTLAMPALVFLVVGVGRLHAPAALVMASYAAFAMLGVAFFQFGVGIAAERSSPWHTFLRVLPAPVAARFAGRVLSALGFGLASASLVALLAVTAAGVRLGTVHWLALAAVLVVGAVPFALFGIAIGYWLSPRGALPAANLLYLASAYLGGLLGASVSTSGTVGAVAPYVPTHAWLRLLAATVGAQAWRASDAVVLGVFAGASAALAVWGFRRDEGQRFR